MPEVSQMTLQIEALFALISKIYILRLTDIRTGSSDKISKQWSNWAFLRSFSKDGHVTHHFAAFLLLITISTFLFRKNHSETEYRKINNFSNFFEMTS